MTVAARIACLVLATFLSLGFSWPADKFTNGIPKIGDRIITIGPSSAYCIGTVVSVNLTFVEMKDACERSMQFVGEEKLTAPGKILKYRWKYIDSWRPVKSEDITVWRYAGKHPTGGTRIERVK